MYTAYPRSPDQKVWTDTSSRFIASKVILRERPMRCWDLKGNYGIFYSSEIALV